MKTQKKPLKRRTMDKDGEGPARSLKGPARVLKDPTRSLKDPAECLKDPARGV